MAYAVPTDVADRLGRDLDESETRIVGVRLDDAERLIKSRIPDLESRVVAGTIDQANVVMIEAEAVLRLVRNPDGYSSETDGNYTYRIDRDVASGSLEILDREWALIGLRNSVFTIRPRMELPTGETEGSFVDGPDPAIWA